MLIVDNFENWKHIKEKKMLRIISNPELTTVNVFPSSLYIRSTIVQNILGSEISFLFLNWGITDMSVLGVACNDSILAYIAKWSSQ